MKRFRLHWRLIETGTSILEAKNKDEAKKKVDEEQIISDFGDPKQFQQDLQVVGWECVEIEEIN